jgi:hypothetical protein
MYVEQLEDRLALATYNVGAGLAYSTIGAVPWNNLQPGDVVNINWQANPYHEKIILSNSGTPTQPIVINGIAGPQGQLPVLDASNATSSPNSPQFGYTPLEDFGLIVIYRDKTKASTYQPSNININNLQLQGANAGTSYTGYAGDSRTYAAGAAGIWSEGSVNLTIHGCTITNNSNGVFAKSAGGSQTTHNITLDSNYLYNNGVSGNYLYHDSYVEAYGALYQYNRYGPLRAGAPGNALKDRSSGTIIRYNYILDGGHLLDLDEPQDGYGDISTDPNYLRTIVYGNVLVSDSNGPTLLVHYGDGGGVGNYRNGGVLYFYDNTVINQSDQSNRWRTTVFQMETNVVSVDARNNIFFNTPQTAGAAPSLLEFGLSNGNINFATSNWVSPGWLTSESAELGTSYSGTITGTNNFFVDPNNNPGFANLATYDTHLLSGSGAIGKSGALASAVASSYPVTSQYVYNQGSQPRPTASDLGAFAYGGSTAGSASTLALAPSVPSTTAGLTFTVTVTAKDSSGNTVTGYAGTVHFTSSDPQAVLPADYTFVSGDNGAHSFSITLKTSGAQTFTATDSATSAVSGRASVTVSAAAASTLLVSGYPTPTTAGTAHSFTVTAKDAFGNTATGFLAPVSFTSSDSQAMLPAPYTYTSADAGVHTFSAMFQTVGTQSLTATDPPVSGSGPSGTEANIVVDLAAPLVTSATPAANASGVATGTAVTATFNESVQQATISFVLTDPSKNVVPATLTYNDTTHTATLTPGGPLLNSTTYTATVSGATDQAGNSMTAPVSWTFTTVAAINHWVQSTAADFGAGSQNGTALADPANGGLQLAPSLFDDFQGTTLSSSWTSKAWVTGGTATLSGGILALAGAEVVSTQTFSGTPVEGRVDFAAAANQQFGLATGIASTSGNSWALFSTKGTKNTLYARVNVAGVTNDVKLGALPSGFHVYRITPVAGSVYFYIDGVLKTVVTATLPSGAGLHLVASATRFQAMQVDWVRAVSYATSGTFTSTIFDATRAANWSTVTWSASVPAGTTLTVQVRYGNTATPDSTWSAWTSVSNGGSVSAGSARYVQYRVILTTSNPTLTPVLNSINFTWS